MNSANPSQRIEQQPALPPPATDVHAGHYVALGRELLSGMLEQPSTASIRTDSPPLRADELAAVRAVADKHRGQPLSLDPIAIGLVRALVIQWFAPHATDARTLKGWHTIADRIAASLYDDPVGRDRLNTTWERLSSG